MTSAITNLASFMASLLIRTLACIRETELRFQQFDAFLGDDRDNVKYYAQERTPPRPNDVFMLRTEDAAPVAKGRAAPAQRNDVLQALVSSGVHLAAHVAQRARCQGEADR